MGYKAFFGSIEVFRKYHFHKRVKINKKFYSMKLNTGKGLRGQKKRKLF